jgi:hypothetical protein
VLKDGRQIRWKLEIAEFIIMLGQRDNVLNSTQTRTKDTLKLFQSVEVLIHNWHLLFKDNKTMVFKNLFLENSCENDLH